jgi:signal transduction histidine kinase
MTKTSDPGNNAAQLVLNVDDYPPGRYTRSRILRQAGFTVQEAATGEEALARLSHRPDLVLLDINLPDIDGFQVCKRIKENPDTAGTLVLHLSATSLLPKHKVAGLEGGADGYLTEPVEPAVLIATVKSLLRIRQAEEGLRRSNESLRSLTDMLSHELREPLRQVSIYAELLHERFEDRARPEEEQFFTNVLSGARRLGALIESVLTYSRSIYDLTTLSNISAQEALDACLKELELLISESGGRVVYEQPLPAVYADQLSLARVFSNLISNSIKYHSDAPPEIRVTTVPDGPFIRFCFEDNGMGIDPKYHSRIFDVFKRLHGAEYPGTGIGLSLCRRIVENMGGSIWVESDSGHGARFYFTVPAALDSQRKAPPAMKDAWV